jgi:hypothetical protein
MVASVVAIRARTSLAWLIATLAAILGINAALHLLGSLVTRTYSPGSITAAFPLPPFGPLRISAGASADCPWPCTLGRRSWCGHSCGRHVPGGPPISSSIAIMTSNDALARIVDVTASLSSGARPLNAIVTEHP